MMPFKAMRLRRVAGSASGHRYWRLNISASGGTNVSLAEAEFLDALGNHVSVTGGTASASASVSGFPASNAFNSNGTADIWASGAVAPQWVGMDFGVGNTPDVRGVLVTARNDAGFAEAPTAFALEYSDNGSSWTALSSFSGIVAWAIAERREFHSLGHRYWRIYITTVGNIAQRVMALGAAGMFVKAGEGETLALTRGSGKTATSSAAIQGLANVYANNSGVSSNAAAFADNGLSLTGPWWVASDLLAGSRFIPREIFLYPQPSAPENTQRTPVNFKMQYSDDNSTWVDYKTITGFVNAWTIGTLVRINVDP